MQGSARSSKTGKTFPIFQWSGHDVLNSIFDKDFVITLNEYIHQFRQNFTGKKRLGRRIIAVKLLVIRNIRMYFFRSRDY